MERLTCIYNGLNALRELCTGENKTKEYVDCASCEECCEEYLLFDCAQCPIQKAFDKLSDYEDAEEKGLLIKGTCFCKECIHHIRTDCGSTTIYCNKNECYMYENNFCAFGEPCKSEV